MPLNTQIVAKSLHISIIFNNFATIWRQFPKRLLLTGKKDLFHTLYEGFILKLCSPSPYRIKDVLTKTPCH